MTSEKPAAPETAVSGPYNTEHGTTLLMTTNPAGAAAVLNAVWRQGFLSGQQEQAAKYESLRCVDCNTLMTQHKADCSSDEWGV